MGREWIEIDVLKLGIEKVYASPSLGREWIEIQETLDSIPKRKSPSLGREWIEIHEIVRHRTASFVSLLGEGVD